MDIIITGVGEYPYHMTAEVAEDNQYGIRNTGLSTYLEEEEALDEDGYDDENIREGTKYEHK